LTDRFVTSRIMVKQRQKRRIHPSDKITVVVKR